MPTRFFSDAADSFVVRAGGDFSLVFLGGDDALTVNGGGTSVTAAMGEGDDVVVLIAGAATVYGEAGDDRFDLRAADVSVHGGGGGDLFILRSGSRQEIGGDDGDDRVNLAADITGLNADLGAGNDVFAAGGHAVTGSIYGGDGNDSFLDVDGASGLDLYGGPGNDTYRGDGSAFPTFIEYAGGGLDTVQLARGVDFVLPANIENIAVGTFAGSVGGAATISGNACDNVVWGSANAETVLGLAGNDRLFGYGGTDSLCGGDGNDVLDGGTGSDILQGDAGNDVLNGRAGDDQMAGGSGDDSFYVDSAGDTVVENAGDGTDTIRTTVSLTLPDNVENAILSCAAGLSLYGNGLDNRLSGNAGDDYIVADGGNDVVCGSGGNDYLGGEAGNDSVNGGAGNDYVFGDEGDDNVQGGDGDDYVQGYTGADVCGGGKDNDFIAGGPGMDVLTGGTGSDTFYFYDVSDSLPAAADRITDFCSTGVTGDQLDLSGLDANTAVDGDQAFAGLGAAPQPNALWLDSSSETDGSRDITLYGDVDGDAVADFALLVHATADLSAGSIIL